MTKEILIIGGGRIGQALSSALKNKPVVFDKDPEKTNTKKALSELTKEAKIIFLAVPGIAYEELIKEIKPYLQKESLIIAVSKGITKNYHFVWQELNKLPQNYGILAGPIMAEDIIKNKPTVGIIGFKNNKTFSQIKTLFKQNFRLINYPHSPKDLSVAGTLKNVYALFLGIIDGLNLGENAKAYFLLKSLREMRILAKHFKTNLLAINGLAGISDLILTAYSSYSDNRQQGTKIAQQKKPDPCEGIRTLEFLAKKIKNKNNLPLLSALEEIILNKKDAYQVISILFPA